MQVTPSTIFAKLLALSATLPQITSPSLPRGSMMTDGTPPTRISFGAAICGKGILYLSSPSAVAILEKNVSANIVQCLKLAQEVGAKVVGVVGRDGGYTAQVADACIIIPTITADTVTAHAEEFQAVVWHCMVSHPRLKRNEMKWESTK